MKKLTAKTKRVTMSFTFHELYLIDVGLSFIDEDNLKEMGDEDLVDEHKKLREKRVLPLFNRWYEKRRNEREVCGSQRCKPGTKINRGKL